jgi:hypothetical protein
MSDKIIENIHKVREEFAKKFDYDIHKMLEDIRSRQERSGRKIVMPKNASKPKLKVEEKIAA